MKKKNVITIIIVVIIIVIIGIVVRINVVKKQNEAKQQQIKVEQTKKAQELKKEDSKKAQDVKKQDESDKKQVDYKSQDKTVNKDEQFTVQPVKIEKIAKYTPSNQAIALGNEIENKVGNINQSMGEFYCETGRLVLTGQESQDLPVTTHFYNQWNDLLNYMWGKLPSVLPKNVMETLNQKEEEWIKTKNQKALEGLKPDYRKMSIQMEARGDITKERINQIVKEYLTK